MARNLLEERLKAIQHQKEMYSLKIKELEKEELKILDDMGMINDD